MKIAVAWAILVLAFVGITSVLGCVAEHMWGRENVRGVMAIVTLILLTVWVILWALDTVVNQGKKP